MRNLEAVDRELTEAREALSRVEGTPTEVYSRIVGYYRSVRNWNRGKREEYHERKLFRIDSGKKLNSVHSERPASPAFYFRTGQFHLSGEERLLLFVRSSCPACPSAKAAAEKLGIPVEIVSTDTDEGMAEAVRFNVLATPTAILFDNEGTEITRARDSRSIAALVPVPVAV